jgi:hypothetical protein
MADRKRMREISIKNHDDLGPINHIVHDCFFDVEDVEFDSATNILKVKFYREAPEKRKVISDFFFFKKVSVPILLWTLEINHVDGFEVIEGGQAGPGSDEYFDLLEYDNSCNELLIRIIIKRGIRIETGLLKLSVKESETITEEKEIFSIF